MNAGLIRIASNYTRLLTTLALGLIVVPLLIGWLGDDAFGIISLLGSSVGVAALFRDLTHRSMIRELGAAYHSGDEKLFLSTYNSSFLISGAVAVLTALSFGVLLALFPKFNIPDPLRGPAMAFLLWQASHAILIVLLSPAFNMYLVKHKFASYNAWYICIRAGNLAAAVLLSYVLGVPGDPSPLALYGFVWATLDNLILLGAVAVIMLKDRRLVVRTRYMNRDALRSIRGTFGWNTGVQVAMAAIEKAPPFILNIMVGTVIANAIWGIAYRLTSYVRMATIGVQFGADSVSAKLSSGADAEIAARRVREFMTTQTRLNAFVALPVGLAMIALAGPLLQAWVGHKVQDPAAIMGPATLMVRILAVAIITRAVSEGWVTVLYGAGYVSRYAWVIFAGGVLAPVLGIVLTFVLPSDLRVQGPALGFMIVVSSVYMFALPVVGARCIGESYVRMLAPMVRPLVVAAVTAPALWLGVWFPGTFGAGFLGQVIIPGGLFGMIYAPLSLVFVLTPKERQRLLRFGRGSASRPNAAPAASVAVPIDDQIDDPADDPIEERE